MIFSTDSFVTEFGYVVPEDSRISKLLRRLCREDDSMKFLSLCNQLQVGNVYPNILF
jgi:hypothetical protein